MTWSIAIGSPIYEPGYAGSPALLLILSLGEGEYLKTDGVDGAVGPDCSH